MNDNNDIIKNSDPKAIRDIAKTIAEYADGLKTDMKKLAQRHQGMHSCWSGKQYDDFSRVIADVNSAVDKQSGELWAIANDTEKDAEQLAKALGIKLR